VAWERAIGVMLALALAPLLPAVASRVKARMAGRYGMPLWQGYSDLAKGLRKGVVYSRTTTALFRLGPLVSLSTTLPALAVVPMLGLPAAVAFPGDLILLAGLLALSRFATVLAALDTGSAFEGMGASREVQVAALAEPALFLSLAVVARLTGTLSLSAMAAAIPQVPFSSSGFALLLATGTLFVVLLAENARIPVDDPTTHLELTMIHEVMVLDHSGPEWAAIQYNSALKLWIFAALVVSLCNPLRIGNPLADAAAWAFGLVVVAVAVGIVESVMARLRLVHLPRLLVGAAVLSMTALVLM